MNLFDKVPEELVMINLDVEDKQSLFEKVAVVLKSYGYIEDEFETLAGLNEREEIMSTGIGQGLAVPHTDCGNARHFALVVVTLKSPIEFHSIDGKPVDVIFILVVPNQRFDLLSRLLAAVSRILRDGGLLNRLRDSKTQDEALGHLRISEHRTRPR